MTPMVTWTTYAVTPSPRDPMRRTTSMATATVVKTKTVARATTARRDAALRRRRANPCSPNVAESGGASPPFQANHVV